VQFGSNATPSPSDKARAPPGAREIADTARANKFIQLWTNQLLEYRLIVQTASGKTNADMANVVLCNRINLLDKSYNEEAAAVVASFLKEPFHGGRSIASEIIEANLSDLISGLLTVEGLVVLRTICDAFADAELVNIDLSENAIGQQGIGACRTVLDKPTLKRLSLCNMGLSEHTMSEVADILLHDERSNGYIAEKMTKIHFYNNMSGVKGCRVIEHILEKIKALLDIRFASTRALRGGSDIITSALDSCLAE
jgi:Ran GTPase-activating protein 1